MQALPAGGAMVAVQVSEDELGELPAGVGVAAVNGPSSLVLSGVEDTVLAVAQEWAGRGRKTRRLAVSHAFHSPLMEPMLDEFRRVVEGLTFSRAAAAGDLEPDRRAGRRRRAVRPRVLGAARAGGRCGSPTGSAS